MSYSNIDVEKNEKDLTDYKKLLDDLMDEARSVLVEKKKKNYKLKQSNRECLFEQFNYISSLRNTATTAKEYKEVYEILLESIQKFRKGSA